MEESTDLAIIVRRTAEQYPCAPITSAEQIAHDGMKGVILDLVNVGYPTQGVQTYVLPDRKEPERRRMREIGYALQRVFAGPKRKEELQRVEQDRRLLENVQLQYEWLTEAVAAVDSALEQFRQAHINISEYVLRTKAGLDRAKEFLDLDVIAGDVAELTRMEHDCLSAEHRAKIVGSVGEQAWLQAQATYEAEMEKRARAISNYMQARAYVEHLADHYTTVVESSERNLALLGDVMGSAIHQQLDLSRTLRVYEGLTRNQVEVVRAVKFLEDVDGGRST